MKIFLILIYLSTFGLSEVLPNNRTLAEELILRQEQYLSSKLPRVKGDEVLNEEELIYRINLLLNNWSFVEKGRLNAEKDIKQENIKLVLLEEPNNLEKNYLVKLHKNEGVKYVLVAQELESKELYNRKFYIYGYNSTVANHILRRYNSINLFENKNKTPKQSYTYSRFGIVWLFRDVRRHWILSK